MIFFFLFKLGRDLKFLVFELWTSWTLSFKYVIFKTYIYLEWVNPSECISIFFIKIWIFYLLLKARKILHFFCYIFKQSIFQNVPTSVFIKFVNLYLIWILNNIFRIYRLSSLKGYLKKLSLVFIAEKLQWQHSYLCYL